MNLYILKQTSGIIIMTLYLGGIELRYLKHDTWHLIMTSYSGGGEVRFAWSSNTWPGRRRRTVYAIHRLVQNACCSNFWFNTLVQLSTGRSWSFNWPVELSALYSQTFTWLSRRLSWTFKRNWSENIQLTLSIRLLLLLARISNRPASETFKINQFVEIWSTKCDYVYTTPLYTPYTPRYTLNTPPYKVSSNRPFQGLAFEVVPVILRQLPLLLSSLNFVQHLLAINSTCLTNAFVYSSSKHMWGSEMTIPQSSEM